MNVWLLGISRRMFQTKLALWRTERDLNRPIPRPCGSGRSRERCDLGAVRVLARRRCRPGSRRRRREPQRAARPCGDDPSRGLRCAPLSVSRRRSRSVPRLSRRSFGRAASRAFGVAGDPAARPAREGARAPCSRIFGGAASAAMGGGRFSPLPCRPGLGGLSRSILVSRLLGTGAGSNPRLATAGGGAEPRAGPPAEHGERG